MLLTFPFLPFLSRGVDISDSALPQLRTLTRNRSLSLHIACATAALPFDSELALRCESPEMPHGHPEDRRALAGSQRFCVLVRKRKKGDLAGKHLFSTQSFGATVIPTGVVDLADIVGSLRSVLLAVDPDVLVSFKAQ